MANVFTGLHEVVQPGLKLYPGLLVDFFLYVGMKNSNLGAKIPNLGT
jgi:hypothetical protein